MILKKITAFNSNAVIFNKKEILTLVFKMKLFFFTTISILVFTCLGSMTYAAGSSIDFEAIPKNASSVNKEITTYFLVEGTSGSQLKETLVVTNPNDYAISIKTDRLNGLTGINGGVVYTPSASTWLSQFPNEINLAAHTTKEINFKINVPKNAAAGDYIFGVSLLDHPAASKPNNDNKTSLTIQTRLQVQKIIAVQVHIAGPSIIRLDADSTSFVSDTSGIYLNIKGTNHSNVLFRSNGSIELFKDDKNIWSIPLSDVQFAPKASFEFKYPWVRGTPEIGHYRVQLKLGDYKVTNESAVKIPNTESFITKPNATFDVTLEKLKEVQKTTGVKTVQSYVPIWVYYLVGVCLFFIIATTVILSLIFIKKKKNAKSE
jgi:hypothetical protein